MNPLNMQRTGESSASEGDHSESCYIHLPLPPVAEKPTAELNRSYTLYLAYVLPLKLSAKAFSNDFAIQFWSKYFDGSIR
jgi:hypothetical protein